MKHKASGVYEAHWVKGGMKIEGDYAAYVRSQWVEGEVFEVEFRELKTTRSAKANGYYWFLLDLLEKHCGTKAEAIHDAMCEMFLPNEQKRVEFFNRMTGEKLAVDIDSRRSSKLSGAPFYDFVEDVRQWMRDFFNFDTPDPDPEYWRKRTPKEKATDVMRREKGQTAA